ncbi:unnamed protein product, partial [Polarella glacialis]
AKDSRAKSKATFGPPPPSPDRLRPQPEPITAQLGGSQGALPSDPWPSGWTLNDQSPLGSPAATPWGSAPQRAVLRIQQPFEEVAGDLDGFTTQFVRAAAVATGVEPQRIRVRSIRPGGL